MLTGRPLRNEVVPVHDLHVPAACPGTAVVEVCIPAQAALIPTMRTVASELANRAKLDSDAISDLRMAVDEACVCLVALTSPDAR